MEAIGDQLDVDVVVGRAATASPGARWSTPVIALNRWVVDDAARRVAGPCLVERRRGVAERRRHAALAEPADQLERARQLRARSSCSRSPSTSGSRSPGRRRPGARRKAGSCAPARRRRDERALEVEPERLGAVGRRVRDPAADALGEPRETGSGAVTAVGRNDVTPRRSSARAIPSSAVGIAHRVVAAPAVDVDVDEPRRDDRASGLGVSLRARPRRSTVLDPHAARDDPVVEDEPSRDGRPLRAGHVTSIQRPSARSARSLRRPAWPMPVGDRGVGARRPGRPAMTSP